jgi:hypothetical protein
MPYLQKKEIQGSQLVIPKATNAKFGDLSCPNCGCWIVTPDYAYVVPGTGRCPRCHRSFKVSCEVALESNIHQYENIKSRGN